MTDEIEVQTDFEDFNVIVKSDRVVITCDFTSDTVGDFTKILKLYHGLGDLLMRNGFL